MAKKINKISTLEDFIDANRKYLPLGYKNVTIKKHEKKAVSKSIEVSYYEAPNYSTTPFYKDIIKF